MPDQRPAEKPADLADLGLPRGIDGHLVADAAYLHSHRPAKALAGDLLGGNGGFGDRQLAVDLGDFRQAGHWLQLVVEEAVITAYPGLVQTPQRQVKRQVEPAVAAGFHALGKAVDGGADRAAVDEAQEFRRWPLSDTPDQQHFVGGFKIGQVNAHRRELRPHQPPPAGTNLHADAEAQVGFDVLDCRPAVGVIDPRPACLGGDDEAAGGRVAEREILEIALEHQTPVVTVTGGDAATYPAAGIGVDGMRHVAPHRPPVAAVDIRRQVDDARPLAGVEITAARRSRRIGAGELQFL